VPGLVLAAMNEQALFDLELKVLLEALYQRYHYDFRSYAVSSLRRRIRQAMQRYECERLADLQHRLLHEPDLFAQAMQFFTVQVSEMFRDPAYFRELREQVVPVLRTYPSVKLWVAGCSTGEEVWSLAILLHDGEINTKKGPIFHAAVLAGVMGAKKTGELIPLCHPLPLEDCQIEIEANPKGEVTIQCRVQTAAKTGVEMEALTAVAVAALTIYDMAKAIDKGMTITEITLVEKTKQEVE